MRPRTRRQKEIFDYISEFVENRGYEPSYQQIAKHFRINSKSAIAKHIAALESQGLIRRRRENGAFSLQLPPKVEAFSDSLCEIEWLDVPVGDDAAEEWETRPLLLPKFMLGYAAPARIRAFPVGDDAMIEKQIRHGDIALIEEKSFARDGDTIVAVIEKSRSLLRNFYRDGAFIELRPTNDEFDKLRLPANRADIRGVFRGLLRPLL